MTLPPQIRIMVTTSDNNSIYKDAHTGEKVTSYPMQKYLDATFALTEKNGEPDEADTGARWGCAGRKTALAVSSPPVPPVVSAMTSSHER